MVLTFRQEIVLNQRLLYFNCLHRLPEDCSDEKDKALTLKTLNKESLEIGRFPASAEEEVDLSLMLPSQNRSSILP